MQDHKVRSEHLLEKAKNNAQFSRQELGQVVSDLHADSVEIQCNSVFMLGYLGKKEFLPELLSLLDRTREPVVAAEIIWVIAKHLDEPLLIRKFVLFALKGLDESWDDLLGVVRLRAATVSNYILAEQPDDIELIDRLLVIVEDVDERVILRDEAYKALIGLGLNSRDLLEYSTKTIGPKSYDTALLNSMKARVKRH